MIPLPPSLNAVKVTTLVRKLPSKDEGSYAINLVWKHADYSIFSMDQRNFAANDEWGLHQANIEVPSKAIWLEVHVHNPNGGANILIDEVLIYSL